VNETFDVTARKFHQAACVFLLAVGFILGSGAGLWPVVLVGIVLAAGRFWWPADIFRQLTWRALEPAGILQPRDVHEDHSTRRVARVLGGVILLATVPLLSAGQGWAWIAVGAIALMIALDAAFDFCVLCALTYRLRRLSGARAGADRA
jgi:hypothetical protein